MSAPEPVVLYSDESDEDLPLGSDFGKFPIDPLTHLFFDDHHGNIIDVEKMTNEKKLNLLSFWCPPTHMTLYGVGRIDGVDGVYVVDVVDGVDVEPRIIFDCEKHQAINKYIEIKKTDAPLVFEVFVPEITHKIPKIGTGITTDIIQQIIANETETDPKRTGLYFFDFDMLLSQFGSLKFPENPESVTEKWVEQYAKYLFSDYIGTEPENGRLNLLKRMFNEIGPDRIYIITANRSAERMAASFVRLLQVLLTSFIPNHLVYVNFDLRQPKSDAIMSILGLKGGSKSKTRKTKRTKSNARKSKTKTRKTKRTKSNARKTKRTKSKARKTRSKASRRSRKNAR